LIEQVDTLTLTQVVLNNSNNSKQKLRNAKSNQSTNQSINQETPSPLLIIANNNKTLMTPHVVKIECGFANQQRNNNRDNNIATQQ
jgi:hypothetical protein